MSPSGTSSEPKGASELTDPSDATLAASLPPPSYGDELVVSGDDDTIGADEQPVSRWPDRELSRGDQVGRYLLLDVLGRGAMGQVFRAYDPDLDRRVAIKVLFGRVTTDATHRERFLREAKAMARIDHPNVITVYDAGVHEGAVFIAMELVEGPSFDQWLEQQPTEDQVLDVLLEAARGLAAAHAAGVVHRDFKPSNVLVTGDDRAKVGDFGLAGLDDTTEGDGSDPLSPGRAVGTPAYMSPEHVVGQGVDARSDQFSFAITMYEALYAERPFAGETWPELASKVLTGELEPKASSRRGRFDAVIRRAMSVEPDGRFPSLEALIEAVERIRKPRWRWWAALGTVGLSVALLASFGGTEPEVERCDVGAERVAQWWNAGTKKALRVEGAAFTTSYAEQARDELTQSIDYYAARWGEAFDSSCERVGPAAMGGNLAQRRTAECIENRYDSLRGLVELVSTETVKPSGVGALVDTLPSLEECADDRWVPYPSDPQEAARAAKLHQSIARVRRLRLSDRSDGLMETAGEVVAEARDLGEPYLLARALGEQARLLGNRGDNAEAEATLHEALQVALAAGHDLLAADIINSLLLTYGREYGNAPQAIALMTVARGLLDDGRRDEILMGNLLLNLARILRDAEDYDAARRADEEAAQHFRAAGSDAGAAKAGVNLAATLVHQGKLDEAREQLRRASEELLRIEGETSPNAFVVYKMRSGLELRAGRLRDALEIAERSYSLAKQMYAPGSFTLWNATGSYVSVALELTDLERVRALLAELRAQEPPSKADGVNLVQWELAALRLEGRLEELVERIPEARRLVADGGQSFQRAHIELVYLRALMLLGRYEEMRQHMSNPTIVALVGGEGSSDLDTRLAMMSIMVGVPPPAATTWSAFATKRPPVTPEIEQMIRVIEAIEQGDGAEGVVRKALVEMPPSDFPGNPDLTLLELWLEHRDEMVAPTDPAG